MIFYFSATGNTKHVAGEIIQVGEAIISIEEATKAGNYKYELADDRLGILTPTYDWGLPSIVYEFMEKLEIKYASKPYTFYVGTFGTITGAPCVLAVCTDVQSMRFTMAMARQPIPMVSILMKSMPGRICREECHEKS